MEIIQHQFFVVKECRVCDQVKSSDAFYKCRQNRDGLQFCCKDCTRDRKNAHSQAHRDELRVASHEWRKNHPDQERAYRERNKERLFASSSKWRKEHLAQAAIISNRYHARKRGALGTYTITEWNALCVKYDHRCLRCGEGRALTADHVVPLSKGGTDTIDNIQPLCKSCNSSKGTKTIDYR